MFPLMLFSTCGLLSVNDNNNTHKDVHNTQRHTHYFGKANEKMNRLLWKFSS